MIKEYFIRKFKEKILTDLRFQRDYGDIIMVDGNDVYNKFTFNNNKCHQNSWDVYKNNNKMKIKVCITVEKEDDYHLFVHFINYNENTGRYFDNTLGSMNPAYNHFVLKDTWIKGKLKDNVVKPWHWLGWAKEDIYNKYCTNWLLKKFVSKNDI